MQACEAQQTECVEYLLDEIMKARKKCLGDSFHGPSSSSEQQMAPNPDGVVGGGGIATTNLRGRHTLDVKEFLKFTVPRQVVFFELGYDCASSNLAQTKDELEKSLYGLMLANTPKAFLHLLNRYVQLFVYIIWSYLKMQKLNFSERYRRDTL